MKTLLILILSLVSLPLVAGHGDSKKAREKEDCRKTPREFRKAEHPYAKKPDGCSGYSDPHEVRDTWGPVNFTSACNAHDRCYYTRGSSWKKCNERFRKDLLNACHDDLRIKIPGISFRGKKITGDKYLPPDPGRYALCVKVALSYYVVVQAGVAFDIFEDAQKLQKSYERWHKRCR